MFNAEQLLYALISTARSIHLPLCSSSVDSVCHSALLNAIMGRCVCFHTRSYPSSVAQASLLTEVTVYVEEQSNCH